MEVSPKKTAQNRIIILYILHSLTIEVTERQLLRVCTELSLMDYFDLASALSGITESNLAEERSSREGSFYSITELGENTLSFFKKELHATMRAHIDEYCSANRDTLRRETSVTAEYMRIGESQYRVVLRIAEKDLPVFEVSLIAANKNEAALMAERWKDRSTQIYRLVSESLLSE